MFMKRGKQIKWLAGQKSLSKFIDKHGKQRKGTLHMYPLLVCETASSSKCRQYFNNNHFSTCVVIIYTQ